MSGRDFVFISLSGLRFDAAQNAWIEEGLPTLAPHLGDKGWELRHSPASNSYAAHHAYFSGYLPIPHGPGPHSRLFATESSVVGKPDEKTFVFKEATIPEAMAARGFRSICIGGTGIFNTKDALGSVLPQLFEEAHWNESFGPENQESSKAQIDLAVERLTAAPEPAFLFINASAVHTPNWFYNTDEAAPGDDNLASNTAALCAFDAALPPLFEALKERGGAFCMLCSDRGTAYGEDGYEGDGRGHPVVWNVPYTQFTL